MFVAQMARFAAFFGGRSDDREGGNPIALLAMVLLAPDRRHADSGGHLAVA